MRQFAFLPVLVFAAASAFAVPDVEKVVTTAQIAGAGSPVVNSDIEMLATDASGRLYFSNATDTNDSDGFAIVRVTSPGPTPTLEVLAGATEIINAVDAANGGNPAPSLLSLRGMGVDSSNRVILAFDPTGSSDSWLVRITPGSPSTVDVIGGGATPNLVDGVNAMAVVGTTAYLSRNGAYAGAGNSPEDSVATFSTDGVANPSQAGTLLVNEVTLTGAGAFNVTSADLVLNSICPYSGGDVLLLDSGASGSSDSVGRSTSGGSLTILKAGTAMESDLAYTDVGFACLTANTTSGNVYLWLNDYNNPNTDGNAIAVLPGGTGTAGLMITETEIAADPDYGSAGLFTNVQGIAVASGYIYWTDDNLEAVFRIPEPASAVSDWSMY
jgi:hypothetical protein